MIDHELPMVSIIITAYNRVRFLREAVESARSQTHGNVEIIIVDDGSDDGLTPRECDRLAAQDPDLSRVIHTCNRGVGAAREVGKQAARGEFVQYLDSDDRLLPLKLELQVAALRANPKAGVAYGITRLIDDDGEVVQPVYKGTGTSRTHLFPDLLVDRWWSTHTPLWRRKVCDQLGPWSEMRVFEDWEYDARAGAIGTRLVYVPKPLSDTRRHVGGHLSGGVFDAHKMRDATRLLQKLASSHLTSGQNPNTETVNQFTRWAFLSCRRAGAAGLSHEAKTCYRIAMASSTVLGTMPRFLKVYGIVANAIGWILMGRVTCGLDGLRGRRGGK